MDKVINVIILSAKSSGSSALMRCLELDFAFRKVAKTSHHESETLFWSKAASVLNLTQWPMHRSVVPYPRANALYSLNEFLNLNEVKPLEHSNKMEIFRAYRGLVEKNRPRFVEKSPHHLFNATNLDLIREYMESSKDEVDFRIIGLVRHPLSVIYSAWQRWKFDCAQFESEWTASYSNMLQYKDVLNIRILRYEDLVLKQGPTIDQALGMDALRKEFVFKDTSLRKWKDDRIFAHKLQPQTIALARKLGYDDFETPGTDLFWQMLSGGHRLKFKLKRTIRKVQEKLLPKR